MKKLPIAVALLSLSIAAPVFACPEGHEETRTAEKAKDTQKETAKADAAKPADKAKDAKPAKAKAEAAKPADKKTAERVSQR